jgi:hypothetical protein
MGRGRRYIPGDRGSASSIRLASNIRALILVISVESEVVDNVASVLDDVGTLSQVAGGGLTAEALKLGNVVGVGGRRKARQDVLLGKEEGASADGEHGSLSGGVLLLELRKVVDDAERLKLLLKDLSRVASKDDENIKVLDARMGLFESDVGADLDALLRDGSGLGGRKGNLERLGVFGIAKVVCSRAQDRQWACKVKQVKLVLERNEHVNGLLVIDCGGLVCSHLERRQ